MKPQPPLDEARQSLYNCEVIDAPRVEDDAVVLRVLDDRTKHVFVCRMKGFGNVTVEPELRENVPAPSAEERAEVAEFVIAYAEERDGHFEGLFSLLPHPPPSPTAGQK